MKKRIWTDILSNIVLCAVVVVIVFTGFVGTTSSVFNKTDYQPYYKGDTSQKNVTLMINVYWGTEYIDSILAILEKYNVHTTFFVGGQWASENSNCLATIAVAGHEIGNHGFYHKDYATMSYQSTQQDMMTNHALIQKLIGIECNLFAPPSGSFSSTTLQCAYDNGYKTIMWSRDTIDWRDKDAQLVYNRATQNISGGELILMHPTAHTTTALEKILQYYSQNGYTVVPVSQNIGI